MIGIVLHKPLSVKPWRVCVCVCVCVCVFVCVWEKDVHRSLLGAASSRRSFPASLSLFSAGCHHTGDIRTEQCQFDSLHSLCWSLAEKGNLQLQTLWRRFWIATVQSPACLQSKAQRSHRVCLFQSPQEIWGWIIRECYFFQAIWHSVGWWAESLLRGLLVNSLYFSVPMMILCFTLDPLYCFSSLVRTVKPIHFIISSFSLRHLHVVTL